MESEFINNIISTYQIVKKLPESFIDCGAGLLDIQNIDEFNELIDIIKYKSAPPNTPSYEKALELYMLLHQKYLGTVDGLKKLENMYKNQEFGVCPRYLCKKVPVLAFGLSDIPNNKKVRFYCPCCKEAYNRSELYNDSTKQYNSFISNADGAFFGSALPQIFFEKFEHFKPTIQLTPHVPTIYGYSVYGYQSIIKKKLNYNESLLE